jgi:hypothetical protein
LALLAMPVGSWAQQTSPTPSQTSRPSGAQMDQKGSANEHLRQAEAALSDIPAASLTGANKAKVAELKRHIGALGRTAAATPAPGKTSTAPAGKATWSTEVAAADRILTELLGAQSTTGATTTGTTGSTSTKPGAQSKSSTSASATLDESARAKLQEVRTHLTAFAASMSGGNTPGAPTPSADDPASPASASAAAAPASTTTNPASSTATASAAPSAQAPTASAPATPSEPSAAAATPQAQSQTAQAASPAQSVDTDGVKRHLTAARDSLSQMTQLPAAAQLTGDARTQVSQLISNFNELITTSSNWKAAYDKVQANLTSLIGEQRADESPAPAAGTAGAVGTSGTTALDPGIRGKLVEFRTHLMDFEKAAGGGSSASASSPAAATPSTDPAAAAASTAAPASATPAASPSTSPAPTATPEPSAPTATPEPSPTGTSGRSSSTPSPAGTSGTAAPGATPSAEPQERPSSSAAQSSSTQKGMSSEAMRHIEAIEAILNGSATAGTTGSTATTKTGSSLDRAQIEQIRTHLAALRKALNEK